MERTLRNNLHTLEFYYDVVIIKDSFKGCSRPISIFKYDCIEQVEFSTYDFGELFVCRLKDEEIFIIEKNHSLRSVA